MIVLLSDRGDVREEDCGAEEEVEGFQKEAEVQHEGVDDRSLERGPAEVIRLEDGVAGKGVAEVLGIY